VTTLPDGAWPVMLLPLHEDETIDWAGLDAYTDWLIEQGSAGLFPVALSGEMYNLTSDERLAVARRVVERSAGRVPVIASIVETGPAAVHAQAARDLAETGVDAVVLIASMILEEGEDESELAGKVADILAANPGVDFGIYECPLPYHRILSTDTIQWLAETGRFVFFKETSHDVALMADRVRVSQGTPMKVYNAGIETLVDSLKVGVSGLSGWVVNVYPEKVAWLCANGASIDYPTARLAQDALDRVERGMGPTYPNSAKFLLGERSDLSIAVVSRWNASAIDAAQLEAVAEGLAATWTQLVEQVAP
jgi:4-hydroxy-tetrahydrodipicolinate synthase